MNTDQANHLFCVVQSSTSNTFFFNRFTNTRDNVVFSIVCLISVVNPDPIEDFINGVPVIASNEQDILMRPTIHSPIPMHNDLEANESKGFFHPTQ